MNARLAVVLLATVGLLGLVVVVQGADRPLPGNQRGYEPIQPVRFSHLLHAGEMQIACLYCHAGAERSRHAGIPTTTLCMNCHEFVSAPLADVRAEETLAQSEGRDPGPVVSPEIRKIYTAMGLDDRAQPVAGAPVDPIRWIRVHNLPDFVFFDHRSHLAAGVECRQCHGSVEAMERVRQEQDLSMGWCVNCHRQHNATIGSGDPRPRASTDCTACHY
jgi:hypothetical protein